MTISIRQYKTAVTSAPEILLDAAPLPGNTLIAVVTYKPSDDSDSVAAGSGWTILWNINDVSVDFECSVYPVGAYKQVTVGEGRLQTVLSDHTQDNMTVTVWEIGNFPASSGDLSTLVSNVAGSGDRPALIGGTPYPGDLESAQFPFDIPVSIKVLWTTAFECSRPIGLSDFDIEYSPTPLNTQTTIVENDNGGNSRSQAAGWYSPLDLYVTPTPVYTEFNPPDGQSWADWISGQPPGDGGIDFAVGSWSETAIFVIDGPYTGVLGPGVAGGENSGEGTVSFLTSSKIKYVVIS